MNEYLHLQKKMNDSMFYFSLIFSPDKNDLFAKIVT